MNPKSESPLGAIMDFFTKSPKKLDQVRAATNAELAKLGKEVGAKDLREIFDNAEAGLKLDLKEMGVKGQAQAPALQEFRNAWPNISETLLRRDIDTFIGNLDNLPILKAEKAKAKPAFKDFFAGIAKKLGFDSGSDAGKGFLAGTVGAWLVKNFDFINENPFLDNKDKKAKSAEPNKTTKAESKEAPKKSDEAEKKDKEILEKNIHIYLDTLKNTKPAPTVFALLEASEKESDIFKGKVLGTKNKEKGDLEAQKEAVRQFMAVKTEKFGILVRVSTSAIFFKNGETEIKYEITIPEKGKFAVKKEEDTEIKEFDGTLSDLVTVLESIETPTTS